MVGGEVGAPSAVATAVVTSYSQGKGGFKIREEVFDLVVLVGGVLGELAESPLEDLIAVRGGGGQVS